MLRILTVLCLAVGASVAGMGGGGGEAMIKKYAYMKIMASCIGEDTVMKYKMEMKAACDSCKAQDINQLRKKRHIDLSPEGIEKMKSKMMAKLSNITCVLKELNVIDAENQPNYEYFNGEINNWPVEDALKEDFREAMDMCRGFATCLPFDMTKDPVKKEFGPTMAFLKCMHKKKVTVCMKNDLRKYAGIMGFEGDVYSEEGEELLDNIITMVTEGGDFM